MKRFLALWLPDWPVQRLVLAQPELAGRAIVLYEKHPRYGQLVKACSTEAAAGGVHPGMPLAEAQILLPLPLETVQLLSAFLAITFPLAPLTGRGLARISHTHVGWAKQGVFLVGLRSLVGPARRDTL